jgi:hypothetical protein
MADLDFNQASQPVQIVGGDEIFAADINANKDLNTSDGIKTELVNAALTVGTTAIEVKVGATRLAERKGVILYNNSNRVMFWGGSGVTTANGIPLAKGESITIRNEDVSLFVVSDQANLDARVVEFR